MEKKVRIKKMKDKPNGKKFFSSLVFAVIALVIAGGAFIGLLYAQSYFNRDVVYIDVVCAKVDILQGEIITEENIETYFDVKRIPSTSKTEGNISVEDAQNLIGCKAIVTLYKGEEITLKDFNKGNKYLDSVKNPVEVSIAVSSMESSDGGKIRAGDIVNITLMFSKDQLNGNTDTVVISTPNSPESNGASYVTYANPGSYNYDRYSQYILENIYVKKVLNADGLEIEPTDTESSAAVLVFVISKETELELNNALSNCESMRISKLLYDLTDEEIEEVQEEPVINPVDIVTDDDVVIDNIDEDIVFDDDVVTDDEVTIETTDDVENTVDNEVETEVNTEE